MNKAPVIARRVNEFLNNSETFSESDLSAWLLSIGNARGLVEDEDGGEVLHVRIESDIVNMAKEASRLSGMSLPTWTKRAILNAVAMQVYPILNLFDEDASDIDYT